MLHKNQIEQATITAMSSDGNGIAKIDGMVVFVPYTAVGDQLQVRIVKVQKNFAFGIIDKLLQPSPDRVEDRCPVYKKCGGCAFRHISYEAELRHKAQFVEDNLRRIGGLEPKMLPITPSPLQQGYRNKAQYPIREEDGEIVAGFFAKRSHRVISCPGCDLQPAFFEQILEYTLGFVRQHRISAYNEESGRGLLRHLYLRYGEQSGQVMVCLVLNGDSMLHESAYVDGLLEVCPQVASVVINMNRAQNNVILGSSCRTLYGKDTIEDRLCGVRVALSPLSFYQVNRQAAQKLYELAAELADFRGDELLVDLYCGAGTIGLSMAGKVRELVGVEIVPDAVENARENARNCGAVNARFLCADAKEAAAQLAREGLRPDVVVVDPPRKGCDSEVLRAIAQMGPERLIYISCNSASLARDCKELAALGYRLEVAAPVDLFPRTAHVETVVLLSQQKPDDTIEIDLDLDELDATTAETKATYEEIKAYVWDKHHLKVSSLYISQVKRKCGLEVGQNYNLSKSENPKVPKCPPEKEAAIMDALKHFQMI